MQPLLVLFLCILLTFLVSRLITFAVLVWRIVPESALSNGRRPHHFVYGNILILLASFAVIGLHIDPSNIIVLTGYGIGLGLVLDEFPHWMGDTKELGRNVPIIPGGLIATSIALAALLVFMILN